MGVTAPTTVLTTAASITQSGTEAFMPPFTAGIPMTTSIPVSPHAHIRARLDDSFIAMQNFTMPMTTREKPYGMSTSMMEINRPDGEKQIVVI